MWLISVCVKLLISNFFLRNSCVYSGPIWEKKHPQIGRFVKNASFKKNFFLIWIKSFKKNLWLGKIQLPLAFLDYPNAHLSNKEALLLKWKALSQEQFVFNYFHFFKSEISSFFITFIWNFLTYFTHTWCMQYQVYAIKCQCLSYN